MIRGSNTYFYHYNAHGDVVALTDSTGSVVAEYEYDAWGNPITTGLEGTAVNPYRYASYRWDSETGMYYLNARYYEPSVGRFITRDTFQGVEDDPQSLHQYAYTKNNPVMYIDSDGHIAVPIAYAAAVAVLGVGLVYYFIKTLDAIGKLIDQSFASVKTRPSYRTPYETHHIVAQYALKAQPSRNVLSNVGIGVNSSLNLVSIKTGLHRRLHTNIYYDTINTIMNTAYNSKYTYSTNKNRVIAALSTITVWLKTKSFFAPF